MKINRNSWHARWYVFITKHDLPNDLCNYLWRFLWANLWRFLLTSLILCASILFAAILYDKWPDSLYAFLFVMGCLFGAIVLAATMAYLKDRLESLESPDIIRGYVKAKKERYCPRIEWVE